MARASLILATLFLAVIISQNTYATDAVVPAAMEATPPAPAVTWPHTSPPGEAGLGNYGKKTMEDNDIPAGPEHQFAAAPPTPSDDIVSEGEVTSNKTVKKEPNA